MTERMLNKALEALRVGLCPLPPREDGSKRPGVEAWKVYQQTRSSEEEVRRWYSGERQGLGLVCGAVSGNLELLEFEGRAVAEGVWQDYKDLAVETGVMPLLNRVMTGFGERSPSGGIHLLYRCEGPIGGNTHLASRPATPEELAADPDEKVRVLIETRGEGGYVIVAPSNGHVHPTGRPYEQLTGGFDTIERITAGERDVLLQLARSLNRVSTETWTPPAETHSEVTTSGDLKPGDDFNVRGDWARDILEPAGWSFTRRIGNRDHWYRKSQGLAGWTSATVTDQQVLYVFSTSTGLPSGKGLSKYSAYGLLHHGGDFKAAARALREMGYGSQSQVGGTILHGGRTEVSKGDDPTPVKPVIASFDEFVEPGPEWAARADEQIDVIVRGVLVAGGIGFLISDPKAGKTWLAMELTICTVTGAPLLHHYSVERTGKVLYIATEGRRDGALARLRALCLGHGIDVNVVLTGIDFIWRRGVRLDDPSFVAWLQTKAEGYRLIVIDVLVDAWDGDENRAAEVSKLLRGVRPITDHGTTVLLLHHLSKGLPEASQSLWQRLRGSTAFRGAYDSGIALERPPGATTTKVTFEHRDDAPADSFTFSWPDELVDGTEPATLVRQPVNDVLEGLQDAQVRVLKLVEKEPGLSRRQLIKQLGGRTQAGLEAIQSLLAAGQLTAKTTKRKLSDGRTRYFEGLYRFPTDSELGETPPEAVPETPPVLETTDPPETVAGDDQSNRFPDTDSDRSPAVSLGNTSGRLIDKSVVFPTAPSPPYGGGRGSGRETEALPPTDFVREAEALPPGQNLGQSGGPPQPGQRMVAKPQEGFPGSKPFPADGVSDPSGKRTPGNPACRPNGKALPGCAVHMVILDADGRCPISGQMVTPKDPPPRLLSTDPEEADW